MPAGTEGAEAGVAREREEMRKLKNQEASQASRGGNRARWPVRESDSRKASEKLEETLGKSW